MAEYMDIARIDDWNDLSIIDDDGCATYVYDVGELPRADVVEREKIDKAIEEIETIRNNYEKINNPWGDRWEYTNPYDKVLQILKRNIGE